MGTAAEQSGRGIGDLADAMMRPAELLRRDEAGVGTVEFALTFPLFLLIIIGALELGASFLSSAGLRHGVNEAGRYATIYPTPTDDQIRAHMSGRAFGVMPSHIQATIERGEDKKLGPYMVISARYEHQSLSSFAGFTGVTLTEVRKVWLQPEF